MKTRRRRFVVSNDNTVLVITRYAESDSKHNQLHPIALHARRVLTELSKKKYVIVLAERSGKKKLIRENQRMIVHRVWRKNNPFSLFAVLKYVFKYNDTSTVLLQFDFDVYGGLVPTFILPILILIMKLMGKHISIELHQAPDEITVLKRHSNIHNKYLKIALNKYLQLFYRTLGVLANKIIVFEEDIKDRITQYVNETKIVVLPLGVYQHDRLNKGRMRQKLHIPQQTFSILSFGFFDWHKGTDWLVQTVAESSMRLLSLMVVGGPNPGLQNNENYTQFYKDVIKKARKSNQKVRTYGFVPEDKLAPYFSAADLIVFPYRQFIAAPTALTHALSYRKPVIFSNNLLEYSKSSDFQQAMEEAGLTDSDLFFPLHKTEFEDMIRSIRSDKDRMHKLQKFAVILGKLRSSTHLKRDYENIISRQYAMKPRFAFHMK